MKKSKRPPRERLIVPVIEDDAEMTPEEIKAAVSALGPLMEKASGKSSSPPASSEKSVEEIRDGSFTKDELETLRSIGLW